MSINALVGGALTISMVMVLAGVGLTATPRWRPRAVTVMPIVLAITTCAMGGYFVASIEDPRVLLTGVTPCPPWWGVIFGSVTGMVFAYFAFLFEARVTRAWYRNKVSRDVWFLYVPIAGRSETMTGVAELAQKGRLFAFLSVVSACGEEFFYRGVFLLGGIVDLPGFAVQLFVIQAVLYGANHVAFGIPTVVGKTVLGFVLGAAAIVGGIPAAILTHLFYQFLVSRQFRPHESAAS